MSKKKKEESPATDQASLGFDAVIGILKKMNKTTPIQIGVGEDIKEIIQLKDYIDTGSTKLNFDLNGGIPRGRIVELYGMEASGKSTCSLEMIKSETTAGRKCALFDVEHSHNYDYLVKIGIDMENLLLVRPSNAEQTWEAIEVCAKSGSFSLIVLDSIAALLPKAVESKGVDGDTMARLASLNTKAISIINPHLSTTNTTLMLINQVRQGLDMFGPKETTPGGNIIKFMASVRIRIKRSDYIKNEDGSLIGQVSTYQVVKSKTSTPGAQGNVTIIFGQGFDPYSDMADFVLDNPHYGIRQAGAWILKDDVSLTQGRARFIELLRDDPNLFNELKNRIITKKEEESKDGIS